MRTPERSWPLPVALIALSATTYASSGCCSSCQGSAAGTQVFTEGIGGTIFGTGVLAADPAKGAGWAINLAIAESAIRRPAPHRPALPTCPQQTGALA